MWRAVLPAALAAIVLAGCSGSTSDSFFPPSMAGGTLQPGWMSVKVAAAGPLDFDGSQYTVVFNTSGSAKTPLLDRRHPDYSPFSYALIAGGSGTPTAAAFAFGGGLRHAPALLPLVATPRQFAFDPNLDGLGMEYEIMFSRALFGARTGPAVARYWRFNAFVSAPNTSDARFSVISSLGTCKGCFASPELDMTKRFDVVEYVKVASPANPSTQIVRVEIINNP